MADVPKRYVVLCGIDDKMSYALPTLYGMFPTRASAEDWLKDYHYYVDKDGWLMGECGLEPIDHAVQLVINVEAQIG